MLPVCLSLGPHVHFKRGAPLPMALKATVSNLVALCGLAGVSKAKLIVVRVVRVVLCCLWNEWTFSTEVYFA